MKLVDVMVATGLVKSKTEARNLIRQGAVSIWPAKPGEKLFIFEGKCYSTKGDN